MHVWNVLHAARWKYRMQKITILAPSHNFVRLYLRCWGMYRQSEKTCSTPIPPPHVLIIWWTWPPNGWDLLASLVHPCKFQRLSRLGSVTARHSGSGCQPNFAALNRGHHLYSAGRPSRWSLAHILVSTVVGVEKSVSSVCVQTITCETRKKKKTDRRRKKPKGKNIMACPIR